MLNKVNENGMYICPICKKIIISSGSDHHVFGGAKKGVSEKYGFLIKTHKFPCHRKIHDHYQIELKLKVECQHIYEECIGSEEEFIKEFGQSYKYRKPTLRTDEDRLMWNTTYVENGCI